MLHVIVGAGPVGTVTATLLADRGEQVRAITRREPARSARRSSG